MNKLISSSRYEEKVDYHLSYVFVDSPGAGFSFPCDANGKLFPLNPCAQKSYDGCVANTHKSPVRLVGVIEIPSRIRIAAVLECDCGEKLHLEDAVTNECGCGRFYNGSGQSLIPPHSWGEETGERFDARGGRIL